MAAVETDLNNRAEAREAGPGFVVGFTLLRNFCGFVIALAGAVAFPTQPAAGLALWLMSAAIFAL